MKPKIGSFTHKTEMKVTHGNWSLKESEDHFTEGFSNALIGGALLWAVLASLCLWGSLYKDWLYYCFVIAAFIGGLLIGLWIGMYLIPLTLPHIKAFFVRVWDVITYPVDL